MIRESALVVIFSTVNPKEFLNRKIGDVVSVICGNCGFDAITGKVKRLNPICIEQTFGTLGIIEQGQSISKCSRCGLPAGALRPIRLTWDKFINEGVEINKGDYLIVKGSKFFDGRTAFGMVIEGEARNEFGLRSLKVLDEFSGKLISPKNWFDILGHWRSNDLSKHRTGSLRNWSF
jgi:hypothetical protein